MRKNIHPKQLKFKFIQPKTPLPKIFGTISNLTRNIGIDLEILNTLLPKNMKHQKKDLKEICKIPKMSSFVLGAIINSYVSNLPKNQVYLNIGVWEGFTLLAGMIKNPKKICIGVDNFCEFGNPRDRFLKRFQNYKSKNHFFYNLDYEEYFKTIHKEKIGCYMYDGDHSYKNQLKGLRIAEPYFAKNCIIIIDDTNFPTVQKSIKKFISERPNKYKVLLDQKTSNNGHPTFWNGLTILKHINN